MKKALRTKTLVVRLTEKEQRDLTRQAQSRGLPLSTWTRMILREQIKEDDRHDRPA